jgi:multiple antibiotic resistance protein
MSDLSGHTISVFLGFFAIMNPIANTPIFLGLTAGDDASVTRQIARNAMLLTFVLIALFSLLGRFIFEMFGISLPAFRITGGVLVALIGYHMLQGEQSSVHSPSSEDVGDSLVTRLSVAVSPLAVPILAGPGTIATAMNFAAGPGLAELVVTLVAFAVLCVITYFCFVFGNGMVRFLGQSGLNVVTRMMGLILAVIGVQMLIEGIKGAFSLGT